MLTESERQRILIHLGYPATPGGVLVGGGTSFPSQRTHVAENQMERLTADGETRVRKILVIMDGIETRLEKAQSRLAVTDVENIKIRRDEPSALEAEYSRWQRKLADTIGCYTAETSSGSGGGINVRRVH